MQAANFLDIKGLLDLGCKTVASMIIGTTTTTTPNSRMHALNTTRHARHTTGKTPEEIEQLFRIPTQQQQH
jgi:hypothetical protein